MFPLDEETGAYGCVTFMNRVLQATGAGCFTVFSPLHGHPSEIHEQFGGGEVNKFRAALVSQLKLIHDEVFRVGANEFAVFGDTEILADWQFEYRGIVVSICTQRVEYHTASRRE